MVGVLICEVLLKNLGHHTLLIGKKNLGNLLNELQNEL